MNSFTKIAANLAIKTAAEAENAAKAAEDAEGFFSRNWNKLKDSSKRGWARTKDLAGKGGALIKRHPVLAALTALGLTGTGAAGGYYLGRRNSSASDD